MVLDFDGDADQGDDAPLIVMLGGFLFLSTLKPAIFQLPTPSPQQPDSASKTVIRRQGLALILVGLAWFFGATFGIVAPLAREYFGTTGPVYLSSRYVPEIGQLAARLLEPARLRYLIGLLATGGGLALLAPHYLLLGLPLLVANTFSNYAGQYSGEQHYSAPLVAILMIAACYGLRNLQSSLVPPQNHTKIRQWVYGLLVLLVLSTALIYQARFGWTPISRRAAVYLITPHTRLLPSLLAQVPAAVPISASAALHPHLAHRPVAYTFPDINEAEVILVDVTDVPGVHPNDLHSRLSDLLHSGEWTVRQAVDGFILLHKTPAAEPQTLPDSFFSFARHPAPAKPQVPLSLTFGGQIELLGFDLLDDPSLQQTALRFYWRSTRPNLADDLTLWPQFFDDFGRPLTDPHLQPMIASVWYPPHAWRSDEIIVTETLPDNLGSHFHLALGVSRGNTFTDPQQRLTVTGAELAYDRSTWAHVASFSRSGWALDAGPPQATFQPARPYEIRFAGGLRLTGVSLPFTLPGDQPLPVRLDWETDVTPLIDYTIFLHLIDGAGKIVAQKDARPFWLYRIPHLALGTGPNHP